MISLIFEILKIRKIYLSSQISKSPQVWKSYETKKILKVSKNPKISQISKTSSVPMIPKTSKICMHLKIQQIQQGTNVLHISEIQKIQKKSKRLLISLDFENAKDSHAFIYLQDFWDSNDFAIL